jgi:two-component system sensor histidine kinase KdpD
MVKEVRDKKINEYLTAEEFAIANWVFINNKHAGATTNTLSGAKCLYMSIHSNYNVFAVVGIVMSGDKSLDPFEKGLLISMLDESAMALEKENALEAQRRQKG